MYFKNIICSSIILTLFKVTSATEENVQLLPASSSLHPLVGNWTIKLLGNQGIFMQNRNSWYVADSHVYVELIFDRNIVKSNNLDVDYNYESMFKFKLQSLTTISPGTDSYRNIQQFETSKKLKPLSGYSQLGKVLETFEKIDKKLRLTMNKTLSIPYDSDLYTFINFVVKEEFNFEETSNGKPYLKIVLKLHVRDIDPKVSLISLHFLETRYPGKLFVTGNHEEEFDYICTPGHTDAPTWTYQNIAYEKDGLVYYAPSYPTIDCKTLALHHICLLPKILMENWEPDPCLSSIHQNKTIEEIQSKCRLNCKKKYPNVPLHRESTRPEVIEVGDTLYISNVNVPIRRICQNSSLDILIRPPPAGALGMKLPCLCKLDYKNELLWSRMNTENPPFCTNNASETFDVFQVLPSEFVKLDQKNISKTDLDSQLFLNFSGHIIGRELVESLLVELKNTKDSSYWNDWLFNFLISLAIVVAIEFCRSRGIRQNVLPQPVVAQFIPARRRRKG